MNDLRQVDLNLLIALDALLMERNVSRAARRIGLGQPAMSHALSRLRDLFGDPLFVRAGRVLQPTSRAVALSIPLAEILEDIRRRLLSTQSFDPRTDQQILRIGASDYGEASVMPAVLTALRCEAPEMRVVLQSTDRDQVSVMLDVGTIDFAIGFFPDVRGPLRYEVLFREEFVCLFDPEACGMQPPLDLDAYLSLPHLLMSPHGELEGVIDARLRVGGRARQVFAATPHFLAIPYLLHGLRAIAAVPRRLAEHCCVLTRLATCDLPVHAEGYDVSLIWHARTEKDPARLWFRDLMRRNTSCHGQAT